MNGIIFKNIDTGESVRIHPETEGKWYGAKLSALMNSSNMSLNSDRGQDYGWRLDEEQQALIEQWEQDPRMIDTVSNFTNVQVDGLTHAEFLAYLLHTQILAEGAERKDVNLRRERQAEYDARVQELRNQAKPEPMAPFEAATVEQFLSGELTGDAGGDKVEEYNENSVTPVQDPSATNQAPETPVKPAPKKK